MSNKKPARQDPRRNVPAEPIDAVPDILARRPDAKPARSREWDKKRTKATFDLPPELVDELKQVAADLAAEYPGASVRVSDVAKKLLEAGLAEYRAGRLRFEVKPSRLRLE